MSFIYSFFESTDSVPSRDSEGLVCMSGIL